MKKRLITKWYFVLVVVILIIEAMTFIMAGSAHTYVGIHDNLDIHITDYQLLRDSHAFFSHNVTIPILGGIDRNFLLSEFYLYSVLYMIFPTFTAYIIGYFMKILIALGSGILLGKDIFQEKYPEYEWLVVLFSLIYGLLPLYPAFSFAFSSIPLLVWLIRRVVCDGKTIYFLLSLIYPILSYFTFFGPFIVGYLFLYFLWKSWRDKRICIRVFISTILITIGYVLIEYRLFYLIFSSGEPTIRDTMIEDDLSVAGVIGEALEVFRNSIFHAEDLHRVLVIYVVLTALVVINGLYVYRGKLRSIVEDPFNRLFLFICFNCMVYGLYHCGPLRNLFEKLIPPLKGWQYNRTVFFNPFLWYILAAIVVKKLYDAHRKKISIIIAIAVLISVMGTQSLYNDFYNTVYVNLWQTLKNEKSETLSYGEFFSESLFESIKKDIDYQGEYSAAYGFHPAVLSYNRIATLDGCLSYYYQSYKEDFRKIIAPALDKSEVGRKYYDNWGARAYLFSGSEESIWSPERTKEVTDHSLLIDIDAFRNLGGKYIFSRIELDNAGELGLELMGKYENDTSPYTIWLYR
ncbi:MAG: DUF6044 family protein [Butyrivibrio sp.]|nr:DUF6044 family protein [Butyrivibrio sp.]